MAPLARPAVAVQAVPPGRTDSPPGESCNEAGWIMIVPEVGAVLTLERLVLVGVQA